MKAPKGIFPGEFHAGSKRNRFYKASGEFRCPKAGEFYLSGADITAYRAPNDLSTEFWVAIPIAIPCSAPLDPRQAELVSALAALAIYCNGKLGKNAYLIPEFKDALVAVGHATGQKFDAPHSWMDIDLKSYVQN